MSSVLLCMDRRVLVYAQKIRGRPEFLPGAGVLPARGAAGCVDAFVPLPEVFFMESFCAVFAAAFRVFAVVAGVLSADRAFPAGIGAAGLAAEYALSRPCRRIEALRVEFWRGLWYDGGNDKNNATAALPGAGERFFEEGNSLCR